MRTDLTAENLLKKKKTIKKKKTFKKKEDMLPEKCDHLAFLSLQQGQR